MSNTCSLCNSTYVWPADLKRHLKSSSSHIHLPQAAAATAIHAYPRAAAAAVAAIHVYPSVYLWGRGVQVRQFLLKVHPIYGSV
jgi:hypothetical protein